MLLKEAAGGTVTVVALDFGDVDNTLYTAAAKGADRIIKIARGRRAAAAARAAAAVYAEAIKPLGAELVLVGVQAHDELDGGLAAVPGRGLGVALRGRDPRREGRRRSRARSPPARNSPAPSWPE